MTTMIALSEILNFQSTDAYCYNRCGECGKVVRTMTHCGKPAEGQISTVRETLDLKRADPEYPDLLDSIRHHGIYLPVLAYGRTLHNGGHRIAAAVDLGLTEIPICNDSEIGWGDDWPDDSVLDCRA